MAWTTIPNSDIDQDSPITQTLMTALRDNPIAIANGDAGAPRLQLPALQEVAAGDETRIERLNANVNNSSAFIAAQQYSVIQSGTIRVTLRHRTAGAGNSEARVQRNGTTITTWSTSSTSFQSRSIDFSISPGDVISVQHRNTLTGTSEIDQMRARTSGAYLLPFAAVGVDRIFT
jgi:hypothetical protein